MPNVSSSKPSSTLVDAIQAPLPVVLDVWHSSAKPPLQFSYTFETSQPSDLSTRFSGWGAFTTAQKALVQSVMAEYAAIINVRFVEVSTTAADPDFNFGRVSLPSGVSGEGGYSYRYATSGTGAVTSKSLDGYAVFNKANATIDRHTIAHEFGHAMTLKHTGNYDAAGHSAPGPYLPASLDNNKFSVMSYNVNPDSRAYSDHLMLYDIAALQARFGANLTYRTGNDVYRSPKSKVEVIWDAGGVDTIDGSSHTAAVRIDLREGYFSSLGKANNLAIAYGVIIENGNGGSGADTVKGNAWNNALRGNDGNDVINGGGGNDTLIGGVGKDQFTFSAGLSPTTNVDTITDFKTPGDTIALENAVFSALKTVGKLAAASFWKGAAAHDADDRIVYNSANGALVYDANGNAAGGATQFAKLTPGLALTNADFLII